MSDFTDDKGRFSAPMFANTICENTEIKILRDRNIEFKQGWMPIFQHFIQQVGDSSFIIEYAHDQYDFLDIRVRFRETEDAYKVYEALVLARDISMETCAICGGNKNWRGTKLCKKCIKVAAGMKPTGTWLDEY